MHRMFFAAGLGLAVALASPAFAQKAPPAKQRPPQAVAAPSAGTNSSGTPAAGASTNGAATAPPGNAAAGTTAGPSALPQPKRLATIEKWVAYSSAEKSGQICYIVGEPAKSDPAGAKRDPVHVLVTHNTGDKTTNVVSFIAGYKFKDGSDAQLAIGDKTFALFTKDDTAWARDAATDKAIVAAMEKGKMATIKGSPAKGGPTTDTYTLAGFSKVHDEIDKACKVKR